MHCYKQHLPPAYFYSNARLAISFSRLLVSTRGVVVLIPGVVDKYLQVFTLPLIKYSRYRLPSIQYAACQVFIHYPAGSVHYDGAKHNKKGLLFKPLRQEST